jgi:hypothetical protein
MFWNDCNDTKGFHILDTDNNDLDFITNPFNMFHKIYYNDSQDKAAIYPDDLKDKYVKLIVVNKSEQLKFDIFIDDLYKMGVADLSIVDDTDFEFEETGDIDTTEDTMSLLTNYIDNYEIDVDKNKLKQIMQELYVSALRGE